LVRLDRIYQELHDIRRRIDDIEKLFSRWKPQPISISESQLLTLPDNLRKTYLAVASRGKCDATQVASLTGRSRAVESNYLNQLVRMGWLTKRRSSKTLHFSVISELKSKTTLIHEDAFLQISAKHAD